MKDQKSILIPDAMWEKCNLAGAELGGMSSSAFVRLAVQRTLNDMARADETLGRCFDVVDCGGIDNYVERERSEHGGAPEVASA
jgi:hypothetical protein